MDLFEAIEKRSSYRLEYKVSAVPRDDLRKIMQAGLDAHLSKPVEPDLLFETLENLIKE